MTAPEERLALPVAEELKSMTIACSPPGCQEIAPVTLREYEEYPQPDGWQLRLIATEATWHGQPARMWRWDVYCPAHAGDPSPRPEGTWRIRLLNDETDSS